VAWEIRNGVNGAPYKIVVGYDDTPSKDRLFAGIVPINPHVGAMNETDPLARLWTLEAAP
jgi:hypothetical protein